MESSLTIHTTQGSEPGDYTVHEIRQGDQKLLTLFHNAAMKSTRVESAMEKRVFLIDKNGVSKHRLVLQNEYGFKIGELVLDKKNNKEGQIYINNEQFSFVFDDQENPGLVIHNNDQNSFSVTGFDKNEESESILHKGKSLISEKYSAILMSLCWFLDSVFTKQADDPEYMLA